MPDNVNSHHTTNTETGLGAAHGGDFRDKYIASLEEQITMYKGQLAQNQTQMEKMQDKLVFYETKLHEKFVSEMTAQHGAGSTNGIPSPTIPRGSLGDKRRLSDGTSDDAGSRRSSNLSNSFSPAKSDPIHQHHRRSSSQSMNSLPPVDHIAQRPILPSSSQQQQQQQQQQSNGHRTLPRLSLGGFGGSSSSNREPVSFGHRASYSTSGPLSGRDFYGHSAPLSGNGLEPYHPALRHPGHSRHASADFANNMHPGQIYGWKEGPYGMEPLFPVKASGPACDGCRIRKRKCGRQKPHCAYCVRLHRNNPGPNPCTYPSPDRSEKRQKLAPSSAGLADTSSSISDLSKTVDKNDDIPEVSEQTDTDSPRHNEAPAPKTAPLLDSTPPRLSHQPPMSAPALKPSPPQLHHPSHLPKFETRTKSISSAPATTATSPVATMTPPVGPRKISGGSLENLLAASQYTPPISGGSISSSGECGVAANSSANSPLVVKLPHELAYRPSSPIRRPASPLK